MSDIDRKEAGGVEELHDRGLCFGVIAGGEEDAPAAGVAWIRTKDVGRAESSRADDPDRAVRQGCTWLPTPRSSRIDSISQNVVCSVNTSAAPSTPVYFSMTGAAAMFATSSR